MVMIHFEEPGDAEAVRQVNELAFGRKEEARLVDALRSRDERLISLVAVQDGQTVGHILFSPVTVESEDTSFGAMGLGPLAVLPAYQGRGIGSQLVAAGLEECRNAGHEIVVLVGHPGYYPRFGFRPCRPLGLEFSEDVPQEAFMVLELKAGALAGRRGVVRFLPEFDGV
jgi:putative acetyltransferase